jgi:DNA gyrase subunit B
VVKEDEDLSRQAGVTISRFKGLGEMDADQLWETTMNPENRVLIQVRIDDAERADAIFTKLMGDEVSLRKTFIQGRAKDASIEDLDI